MLSPITSTTQSRASAGAGQISESRVAEFGRYGCGCLDGPIHIDVVAGLNDVTGEPKFRLAVCHRLDP